MLAAYAVQICNFEVTEHFQNPQLWSDMLSQKCGGDILIDAFQARSLQDYGEVAMIWGAFFGLLTQAKFTPKIVSGQLAMEPWWKKFARLAVAVVAALPGIGMGLILVASKA